MRSIFLLLLLFFPLRVAAEPVFSSDKEYERWSSNFYLNPEREKIVPAFHYFCNSKLANDRNLRALISHFYAALIRKQPVLADELFESVNAGTNDRVKSFVLNTLWLVNSTHSRELLVEAKKSWVLNDNNRRTIDQSLEIRPQWPEDIPITSTTSIDILWTIFSATGDARPVKSIISVLHYSRGDTPNQAALGNGARWSLERQMRVHKRVLEIMREEVKDAEGATKKILTELLKGAGDAGSASLPR